MMIIKGGTTDGIVFSCMYDSKNINPDETIKENGNTLYGIIGIAANHNDRKAMLYFDANMRFVRGMLL